MGAVASFGIADGQGTPVTHTFNPTEQDKNGVWWWEDSDSGQAIGRCRVSLQVVRPTEEVRRGTSNPLRVYRVKIGTHIPRLETIGTSSSGYPAVPQVNHVLRCNQEFILPEVATTVDRKSLRLFQIGLLGQANFYQAIEELIGVY